MADPQETLLKFPHGQACLLAPSAGVGEKDLSRDGEDGFVGEPFEKGRQETGSRPHIIVEQDNDPVASCLDASVGAAPETKITLHLQHPHLREMSAEIIGAAVGAAVFHNNSLERHADLGAQSRQAAPQVAQPVPGHDHDRDLGLVVHGADSHRWPAWPA